MKYIILFSLLLVLTNCNNQKNDFFDILVSDANDTKIWNYYVLENKKEFHYLGYKYKFEKDKYEIYRGGVNEVGTNFAKDFVIDNLDNDWYFDSKSLVLNFGLNSFIIERYTTDTIFMKGNGFEGECLMIKMNVLK
ncbi:hypothetical protein [Myroides fluvii]|uniref:hypothetical protein n=1 Tax=Myroides fluvii TaxID=2572594 RepID=UPI00131C4336|nr:hypothetical protein [Myroides fluvii]